MKKKIRKILLPTLFILFAVTFVISLASFWRLYSTQRREQGDFAALRNAVAPLNKTEKAGERADAAGRQDKKEVYEDLYRRNSDFYGWICIDGTRIDYPVMNTPEDEEYYLHRSFVKEYSYSGVPFLGRGSTAEGDNLLIYGHNMKDGSMFADLTQYQNAEFLREHPTITLETRYASAVYEIVAAFETQVSADNEFKYYDYTGVLDAARFEEYIKGMEDISGTSLETLTYGDKLLTLSTCAYQAENGRFVVLARQTKITGLD